MAAVFFYVPAVKASDVVECGLKLSEWKDREQQTPWSDGPQPCLCALLHPDDDKRSRDPDYLCIKIDIPAEECIVADGDLYRMSQKYPEIKTQYIDSMVTLDRYMFGSFRKPECLIFTTILGEQISVYGKGLDEPLLYENSETLYMNNLIERYNDRYSEINGVLLYCLLFAQSQNGLLDALVSDDGRLAYFYDKKSGRYVTVPVPDLNRYRLDLI